MKKTSMLRLFMSCVAFSFSSMVTADLASAEIVQAVPTDWRLQDYGDGAVTLYFTGSSCSQGQLTLTADVNNDSKNRLWSIVSVGKTAVRSVGIYYHYDSSSNICVIDSFFTT